MDTGHKNKWINKIQRPGLSFLNFGQDLICDIADHLCRQFDPIKILELIMDIPCAYSTGIKRNGRFFNTGYIPLILWNELRFEFSVPVSGDIHLEFSILTFQGFGRMTVSLVVGLQISILIFFITEGAPNSASMSSKRMSLKLSFRSA